MNRRDKDKGDKRVKLNLNLVGRCVQPAVVAQPKGKSASIQEVKRTKSHKVVRISKFSSTVRQRKQPSKPQKSQKQIRRQFEQSMDRLKTKIESVSHIQIETLNKTIKTQHVFQVEKDENQLQIQRLRETVKKMTVQQNNLQFEAAQYKIRADKLEKQVLALSKTHERLSVLEPEHLELTKKVALYQIQLYEKQKKQKELTMRVKQKQMQINSLQMSNQKVHKDYAENIKSDQQTMRLTARSSQRIQQIQKIMEAEVDKLYSKMSKQFNHLSKEEYRQMADQKIRYLNYLYNEKFIEISSILSQLKSLTITLNKQNKRLSELLEKTNSRLVTNLHSITQLKPAITKAIAEKQHFAKKIAAFSSDCYLCKESLKVMGGVLALVSQTSQQVIEQLQLESTKLDSSIVDNIPKDLTV